MLRAKVRCMNTTQSIGPHQYIDRNGNVRTIALRHRVGKKAAR